MEQAYIDYITKQVDSLIKKDFPERIAALDDLLEDPNFSESSYADSTQGSDDGVPQFEDAKNSRLMSQLKFQVEPLIKTLLRDSNMLQFVAESEKESGKYKQDALEAMQAQEMEVNDAYTQVTLYIIKRLGVITDLEEEPHNENLRRQIVELDKTECLSLGKTFAIFRNRYCMLYKAVTGREYASDSEYP